MVHVELISELLKIKILSPFSLIWKSCLSLVWYFDIIKTKLSKYAFVLWKEKNFVHLYMLFKIFYIYGVIILFT